jgi:DNA-binding CsgD family transcriptional regulator
MGCSFEETANMMGLSETAVRQHLSRAMRKMGDINRGNRAVAGKKAAKIEKHS